MTPSTEPHASVATYVKMWAWLAGLMLAGVLLSELPITKTTIVLLVLALSSVKAVLVACYYMHLKFERRLLTLILLAPFALVALAVGVILSSALVRL